MPKFLIDANLPYRFSFWNTPDYEPVMDPAWGDNRVWSYATEHQLTVITKDADYEMLVAKQTPPKVIRFCIGNMRRRDLWIFLQQIWPAVLESLGRPDVRLVRVFSTHLEAI